MTREEALKLLKGGPEGVAEWNRRRDEGDYFDDLAEADLSRVMLADADLSQLNLYAASFAGAFLGGTNLFDSILTYADFRRCQLPSANLRYCELSNARFHNAIVGNTVFASDLSKTAGLDSIRHYNSSTVDINKCLLKFKDDLPEKFLRGCGLRDEEIAYFRSQIGKPIRFFDCFISYSSADEEFATRLHNDFQNYGIRCWKWNEDARTGKSMWGEIDHAIRKFDKLVLIASKSSLESPYVQDEVERAIQKERQLQQRKSKGELISETDVLFPVRLDDYIFNEWEHERKADVVKKVIADARGWEKDAAVYNKVRDKLIKDLKRA